MDPAGAGGKPCSLSLSGFGFGFVVEEAVLATASSAIVCSFKTKRVRRRRSRRSRAGRRRVGKRAWRVRRGDLLVEGRGRGLEVVVAAFGGGGGRLLRRDERKARGVGRGGGGCGIGWGREAGEGGRRRVLGAVSKLLVSLIFSFQALLFR